MKTDRRTFIKTSALALAGTAFINNPLSAAPKQKGIIGLQLIFNPCRYVKRSFGLIETAG